MLDRREADDAELIKKAQAGDAVAFGDLYERHAPAVFRFIFSHLNNRMDAEDLNEEVFLRVWRSLHQYREQGVPFLAFLFRVARNGVIDFYRRTGRAETEVSIEDTHIQDLDPGPGDILATKIDNQTLRRALDELREDYRTVLVLRFLSELSPEETAQVMGRSEGSVRVLQHRALDALRRALGKVGD